LLNTSEISCSYYEVRVQTSDIISYETLYHSRAGIYEARWLYCHKASTASWQGAGSSAGLYKTR